MPRRAEIRRIEGPFVATHDDDIAPASLLPVKYLLEDKFHPKELKRFSFVIANGVVVIVHPKGVDRGTAYLSRRWISARWRER